MDLDTALAILWVLFSLAWSAILVLFTAMEYPTPSNADRLQRQMERQARRTGEPAVAVVDRKRRQTLLSGRILRIMGLLSLPAFAFLLYRNITLLGPTLPAAVAASGLLGLLLVGGFFYLSFVAKYWIPVTLDLVRGRLEPPEPKK